MENQLLQWGLFVFMIGLVLSLPLAAIHYQKDTTLKRIFIKPSKLRSAHTDYFMQTFSLGFIYVLVTAFNKDVTGYLFVLLAYGTVMNPSILLLEATYFIHTRVGKMIYLLLRGTSPLSLLTAWFVIAAQFLSIWMLILTGCFFLTALLLLVTNTKKPIVKKEYEEVNDATVN